MKLIKNVIDKIKPNKSQIDNKEGLTEFKLYEERLESNSLNDASNMIIDKDTNICYWKQNELVQYKPEYMKD